MMVVLRTMIASVLRDRLTLFWSVVLPVVVMIALELAYKDPAYHVKVLASVISMGVLFSSLWSVGFESIINRNQGVYKLLKVTPFRTPSFLFGVAASRSVSSIISTAIVFVIGMLLFHDTPDAVSLLLLIPLLVFATLSFMFLGIVAGNLAQVEPQVSMYSNLFGMPLLFTSGAFYSLANAPGWLQFVEKINPFHYFVQGILNLLNSSTAGYGLDLLVLVVFTALCLGLSVYTFRWDPFSSVSLNTGKGKPRYQKQANA